MDVVFDVVSDIAVLHFGAVVEAGSCENIRNSQRVQQIYLGTG
jgi:ABC-type branched-subunit amino acid transport system ATPase component